jgi:hypothetical protein
MSIAANVERVREQIAEACLRSGRDPQAVTLMAVSKTHPPEIVAEAIAAGVQHFGENRVEEATEKIPAVRAMRPAEVPIWHMVGHIQSRKARAIPDLFDRVHSVDTVKLADKLSRIMIDRNGKLPVLLEINVSGEEAKYGLWAAGWSKDVAVRGRLWSEIEYILSLPGLDVVGLMTMAPIVVDMRMTRPVFADLTALRTALRESFGCTLPELSMGMTDDFPVAIEEGATIVRVGRAIFGQRR